MKNINVEFTDEEHARLASHKAFLMMDWHDYIINCTEFVRGNEVFMAKHAKNPEDAPLIGNKEVETQ